MNENIKILFNRLMAEIERLVPRAREALSPGASPQEVADFERKTGIRLPDDLATIYALTNGINHVLQDENPVDYSFPGDGLFFQHSLVQAAETLTHFLENGYVKKKDARRFFPIFADNCGYYICVDLAESNRIIYFEDYHETVYESSQMFRSLTSMLEYRIEAYQAGSYTLDGNGDVVGNPELLTEIGLRREGTEYFRGDSENDPL